MEDRLQDVKDLFDPQFEITTSLRWNALAADENNSTSTTNLPQLDGIPLHFHRDRLLSAAGTFKWQTVMSLLSDSAGLSLLRSRLLTFSTTLPSQTSTYKLRLTISPTGSITITASPPIISTLFPFSSPLLIPSAANTSIDDPPSALLYVSHMPIHPSPHTRHKTTQRAPYDPILSQLPQSITSLPPITAEVLLYNPSGQITECVYSTPYFYRDGDLITPNGSCGGNLGVTRRLALENVWCKSGVVHRESVKDGEVVVLSNAVRGFWRARVVLNLPRE